VLSARRDLPHGSSEHNTRDGGSKSPLPYIAEEFLETSLSQICKSPSATGGLFV